MKQIEKYFRFEYLFVVIALIMGWRMAYTNPPWQSNDEDRHFYNAYALSQGQIAPQLKDGTIGQEIPVNLAQTVRSFQGIPFSNDAKVSRKYLKSISNKKVGYNNTIHNPNPSAKIMPLAYLPSAIGIWLARKFDQDVLNVGYWARLFMLFTYILIVFLAIKQLPKGFKHILFVISLSPMIIYQAGSVTYDSMSLALLFLYLAYVTRYYFNGTKIELKHVILLLVIACLQRLSKNGYFLLFFTAFVIPYSRFETKRDYLILFGGLLFATFVPSYFWSAFIESLDFPERSAHSFQKDFKFDRIENLKYHLNDPINAITLIIQNIFAQGKVWLRGVIGRFGYSYSLLPAGQVLIWYALIFITASHKRLNNSIRFTSIIGVIALASIMMIIVGWFFTSPIGAHYVYGLQGRYLSPILPFFVFAFLNLNLFKVNENYWKIGLSVACVVMLNMSISFMDSYFYNP